MQRNDNLQLEFVYNPLGQRILKIEKPVSGGSVVAQGEEVSWKYTYYAYDANNQVMAIYDLTNNPVADIKVAVVEEQMLYGTSRLGQVKAERTVYTNQSSLMPEGNLYDNITGKKRYELTNHLGNVNAVITDRKTVSGGYVVNTFTSSTESWLGCTNASVSQSGGKLQVTGSGGSDNCTYKVFTVTPNVTYSLHIKSKPGTGVSSLDVKVYDGMTMLLQEDLADDAFTTVNFTCSGSAATIIVEPSSSGNYAVDEVVLTSSSIYEAVVLMEADYYPFGMEMPERTYNSGDYRYAYNGMEVDPETKGNGNSYTTEFRQYDPRLGRWLSLDPLMMEFPEQSPYCAFDNNPVYYVDPLGLSSTNKDGGEEWNTTRAPEPNPQVGSEGRMYKPSGEDVGNNSRNSLPAYDRKYAVFSKGQVTSSAIHDIKNYGSSHQVDNIRTINDPDCPMLDGKRRFRLVKPWVKVLTIKHIKRPRNRGGSATSGLGMGYRRRLKVGPTGMTLNLDTFNENDLMTVTDLESGQQVVNTGMVSTNGNVTFNLSEGRYRVQITKSVRRSAWTLSWNQSFQKIKTWKIYLLFGFIPLRYNHSVIINSSTRNPDWDLDIGIANTGPNARDKRRREGKKMRDED